MLTFLTAFIRSFWLSAQSCSFSILAECLPGQEHQWDRLTYSICGFEIVSPLKIKSKNGALASELDLIIARKSTKVAGTLERVGGVFLKRVNI